MTLLLHPGFHKTATSWLQSVVFAEHRLFRSLLNHHEIDDLLVRPHDLEFDANKTRAQITQLRNGAKPAIVDVVSSEILSGNILMGSRDSSELARRLASTVGPAKVLLTVRAQKPITKSIYLQYIKRGGRLGIEEFLTFQPEPGYFWFDPATLEFDRLAQVYAEHFGAESILVLPQELLVQDRPRYLRELCRFVGLDESDAERELAQKSASGFSPPVSGIPLLQLANALGQSPLNPRSPSRLGGLGKLFERIGYRWTWGQNSADLRMKQAIQSKLTHSYAASNYRLQEFAPVDLKSLGYQMDE